MTLKKDRQNSKGKIKLTPVANEEEMQQGSKASFPVGPLDTLNKWLPMKLFL